jgi:hypothetical protein
MKPKTVFQFTGRNSVRVTHTNEQETFSNEFTISNLRGYAGMAKHDRILAIRLFRNDSAQYRGLPYGLKTCKEIIDSLSEAEQAGTFK